MHFYFSVLESYVDPASNAPHVMILQNQSQFMGILKFYKLAALANYLVASHQ